MILRRRFPQEYLQQWGNGLAAFTARVFKCTLKVRLRKTPGVFPQSETWLWLLGNPILIHNFFWCKHCNRVLGPVNFFCSAHSPKCQMVLHHSTMQSSHTKYSIDILTHNHYFNIWYWRYNNQTWLVITTSLAWLQLNSCFHPKNNSFIHTWILSEDIVYIVLDALSLWKINLGLMQNK